MAKITINGLFYSDKLTGIERFAHEITRRLDALASPNEFTIVLPPNMLDDIPPFKNLRTVRLFKTPGAALKKIKLYLYLLFNPSVCLDYGNRTPFFGRNIVFLHDIYCRVFPEDFRSAKDRRIMKKTCRMYERIAKNARLICTVSEFSKKQIMDYYGVSAEKIRVIYNGVEHINAISADNGVFARLSSLKEKEFYFTLGSLSLRKNLKWIADHAELYPNETFVVSGTLLKNLIPPELQKLQTLSNVILAGYLSDGEVKALMQKCKAFVLPSYFEGFGIPPLEALACGAPVIVSNAASLPEIYGKCAHYIDPSKPDVNLDALLKEPLASPAPLFEKYSFDRSAKELYKILQEVNT
ncbi:MAG: glycosyltransferase family 4 protein [Treponema sp.]